MNLISRLTACLLTVILLACPALAENWDNWRGPAYNGSTTETGLPARFSPTQNVKWVLDMPGPSAATPVIWADRVFVSAADPAAEKLYAICVDRTSGQVRWRHVAGSGYRQDDKSNFASPSPVTDGKLVVFFYGNGDLVAYDMDGKKLWSRNLQADFGKFAFNWTFSTSPLLFDGRLYMQILQRDVQVDPANRLNVRQADQKPIESFILAIDPATGLDLWKHVRDCDAIAESREAFSTPIPYTYNGRTELIVVGGDDITAHDPKTGRELWRWGTWNPRRIPHFRLVPSAVAGDGVILACAPKKEPIHAFKAGGSGQLPDSAILWKNEDRGPLTSDVPTPAFYDGDFFIVGDVARPSALSRVVPKTGRIKWTVELPGRYKWENSPTAADGKVYVMNHRGDVVVIDAARGSIIHEVRMGHEDDTNTRSSISVSQGNLFIRTNSKLYCIGN